MGYTRLPYSGFQRFNEQYEQIHQFLLRSADRGCNEHFHWGRFEWMMRHTLLDVDQLDKIMLFLDENGSLVGLVTFDTCFDDGAYLIHATDERSLLELMTDAALLKYKTHERTVLKVNQTDVVLGGIVQGRGFTGDYADETVLAIPLDGELSYSVPAGFHISTRDFVIDNRKCQNVLHKGFNNQGTPEPWDETVFLPTPHEKASLKIFAYNDTEYCAHCGIWYTQGETAYIEPVATIPSCRGKGLARAVVYEALGRAQKSGAKRAVVISDEDFYFRIGFSVSSKIVRWELTHF